jgi:hypothetical protein
MVMNQSPRVAQLSRRNSTLKTELAHVLAEWLSERDAVEPFSPREELVTVQMPGGGEFNFTADDIRALRLALIG